MYLVTIAIPVYRVEKYVKRSLMSALNQTFESIEYLVIDDKGGDKSIDIVSEVISGHPRKDDVRIIDHTINRGTGATKNSAIKNAKGKYLYFMDSDDLISPDCIEKLVEQIKLKNYDFVAASYKKFNRDDVVLDGCIYPDLELFSNEEIVRYKFIEKNPLIFATWNKLYSLEFLRSTKVQCIPHHLCEDQVFTFQVLLNANRIKLLSAVTYFYFETSGSIMNRIDSKQIDLRSAIEYCEIVEFKCNYLIGNVKFEKLWPYVVAEIVYFAMIINSSKVMIANDKKNTLKRIFSVKVDFDKFNRNGTNRYKKIYFKMIFKSPLLVRKMMLVITNYIMSFKVKRI